MQNSSEQKLNIIQINSRKSETLDLPWKSSHTPVSFVCPANTIISGIQTSGWGPDHTLYGSHIQYEYSELLAIYGRCEQEAPEQQTGTSSTRSSFGPFSDKVITHLRVKDNNGYPDTITLTFAKLYIFLNGQKQYLKYRPINAGEPAALHISTSASFTTESNPNYFDLKFQHATPYIEGHEDLIFYPLEQLNESTHTPDIYGNPQDSSLLLAVGPRNVSITVPAGTMGESQPLKEDHHCPDNTALTGIQFTWDENTGSCRASLQSAPVRIGPSQDKCRIKPSNNSLTQYFGIWQRLKDNQATTGFSGSLDGKNYFASEISVGHCLYEQNEFNQQLFALEQKDDSNGFTCVLLPQGTAAGESTLTLEDALSRPDLAATFIFYDQPIPLDSQATVDAFVAGVYSALSTNSLKRALLWATAPTITPESVRAIPISDDGSQVSQTATLKLVGSLELQLKQGLAIAAKGFEIQIGHDDQTEQIWFMSTSGTLVSRASRATIPTGHEHVGAIQFNATLLQQDLADDLRWGFQFLYSDRDKVLHTTYLPLAPVGISKTIFYFAASINPADIFNEYGKDGYATRKTFFNFVDETQLIETYYTNPTGTQQVWIEPVNAATAVASKGGLQGARFVFSRSGPGADPAFVFSPEGDFKLLLPNDKDFSEIVCGLQGTEFIRYGADCYLSFHSRTPAYAKRFPLAPASPADPAQVDKILESTYTTSWATLKYTGASKNPLVYTSQAEDLYLYGQDDIVFSPTTRLLGAISAGFEISSPGNFPLMPYAGFDSGASKTPGATVASFEKQILSPARTREIFGEPLESTATGSNALGNAVTRTGILAQIEGGIWSKLVLGQQTAQNPGKPPAQNPEQQVNEIAFRNPSRRLVQAFQSSDLFLVIANNQNIGEFQSQINIGDWQLEAKIGANEYFDYNNIVIIKARRGKLYDPAADEGDNLVSTPQSWTMKESFAAPSMGDNADPDPEQIATLSVWLRDYFKQAAADDSPLLAKFNSIATDENWTGVLFLRMNASITGSLEAIEPGIRRPDNLRAHHFAVSLSQIDENKESIEIKGSSAMFGMIDYLDFAANPLNPDLPIAPPPGNYDYHFCVLQLKASFQNSQVENFHCTCQLTLDRLFGSKIKNMGPGTFHNSIILKGSRQTQDGKPRYSFTNQGSNFFYPDGNIIRKFEITDVRLGQQQSTAGNQPVFSLSGFIDFHELSNTDADGSVTTFDIFSFGSTADQSYQPGLGLKFSGVTLAMIDNNEDEATTPGFRFSTESLRFDLARSTARAGSLARSFALDVDSLELHASGTLDDLGLLGVSSDFALAGLTNEKPWYALGFNLNLGGPGQLAGNNAFNSRLFLAWSPEATADAGFPATLGISLPGTATGGTKLLSLQNVLKVSIGDIKLVSTDKGFLLMLSDIALKFMGLLKIPPNGSSNFYLFGNRKGPTDAGLGWYAMYRKDVEMLESEGQA